MGLSDDDNELLTVLRSKVRSDKIDDALCEFIVKAWCDTDVTRESEVAKDRVRNPAHHDGEKHRIRYLETTYNEACAKIQKMIETNFTGQQRRTPVSYTIIRALMPFFIKLEKRKTSLCRYHMQFDQWWSAIYRHKQNLRRFDEGNLKSQARDVKTASSLELVMETRLERLPAIKRSGPGHAGIFNLTWPSAWDCALWP